MSKLPEITTLQLLWFTTEALSPQERLHLPEALLVRKILQEITRQLQLRPDDYEEVQTYLISKVPLIRTLAAASLDSRVAAAHLQNMPPPIPKAPRGGFL